jgi:acetylornithine/N-succinyldiaminopimelate aminotransferase
MRVPVEAVMSRLDTIMQEDREYLFQNNGRLPVCFEKGEGAYLFDTEGKRYIDFFSGVAVSALGYAHPEMCRCLHKQIDALIHTSNWYFNAEQVEAAKFLSSLAFKGRTFFANSGTEANEAAIKLARRFGKSFDNDKFQIVTFLKSFHGRSYGGMSATGQEKTRKGFDPLVPGFHYLPYGDSAALRDFLSKNKVCGVMMELIQGEGGINVAKKDFVADVAAACKEFSALLILDEIQTGIGRTGKAFAYQHYGIEPDIITLAKGLGGGVPVGAIHTKEELCQYFPVGAHGTTFGGNHLACAAASAVLGELSKKEFLPEVERKSALFFSRLKNMQKKTSLITDIRGLGLHIGIELSKPGFEIVKKALSRGLIINCTADTVIRIVPPLIIPDDAIENGCDILETILCGEA